MFKNAISWSIITAILTILFYVDVFYFYGAFFITIPLVVLSAIISIIIAIKEKKPALVIINLILACAPIISFIVMPW